MVGDTLRDLQAAHAAGCEPHLVLTGRAAALGRRRSCTHMLRQVPGTRVHADLAAFADVPAARATDVADSERRGPATDARSCWALRSLLFVLWLAVTVVPWALAVLLLSIFVRGAAAVLACVGWLRMAIWGARVICGVQLPRARHGAPADRGRRPRRGAAGAQAPVAPGRPSPSRR